MFGVPSTRPGHRHQCPYRRVLGHGQLPAFDPNNAAGSRSARQYNDHAAATVYEPGSVFKVFTLAMGIDAGLANINTMYDVHTPLVLPGRTIHDYHKGDLRCCRSTRCSPILQYRRCAPGLPGRAPSVLDKYFRSSSACSLPAPSELKLNPLAR